MAIAVGKIVGRPRDETRDAAILAAAVTVLADVGYDRLTIDAVAATAKASKATVYRRWPNKAALVVDAMSTLKPALAPGETAPCLFPDTGSLRGDLLAGLQKIATKLSTDEGKLMCAVMTAAARDPELATAMRGNHEEKRRSCQTVVDRAVARGELASSAGADTLAEVMPALMYNRLLIVGEPFDEPFLNRIVDDVALPLLQHSAAPQAELKTQRGGSA
jgi:AcrR family transcriptional regulator